jgi:iron complex transport system permease protein
MINDKIIFRAFISLCFLLLVISILTLLQGHIGFFDAWSMSWNPVLSERLPRLIVLILSGASLAVAGAVMQALFCNPLASPGVLGINSGGSFLTMLVFVYGGHFSASYLIPIAGFGGCLAMLVIVYAIAKYIDGGYSRTLILVGVALATFVTSLEGTVSYIMRDDWQFMQTWLEWQSGVTVDRSWQHVNMQAPLVLVGLIGLWQYRHEIDILTLGEEEAYNLGVDVKVIRWRLFLFVAMLTGGTMAAIGTIPFFGLVLPHIMRKLVGPAMHKLVPYCVLGGSIMLVGLDLILRVFAVRDFAIGNICSITGGLFFISLLVIQGKKRYVTH